MKNNKVSFSKRKQRSIKLIAVLFLSLTAISCNDKESKIKSEGTTSYALQLMMSRIEKDKNMKQAADSPFQGTAQKEFEHLNYFEPNTNYIVTAKLEKLPLGDTLTTRTSLGKERQFLKFAMAHFELQKQQHSLLLLKSVKKDSKRLFLTFKDATSGEESYGAGRYLDVYASEDNTALLDFNMLYNPYCAYADGFDCPLPPKGNQLKIKILAGEKTYQEH